MTVTAPGPRADQQVHIGPLRAGHLDQVVALEAQVSPRGWSRQVFANELAARDARRYVVALADDEPPAVVGYGGIQVHVDEAHVTTLTVAVAQRRRGIATAMLAALLWHARHHGARSATLEVRSDNVAAQRLYARFGFAPVGVRPAYYASTDDALIMWAHDVDGAAFRARLTTLAGATAVDGARWLPWGAEHER